MYHLIVLFLALTFVSPGFASASAKNEFNCVYLIRNLTQSQAVSSAEDLYRFVAKTTDLNEFAIKTYGSEFGFNALKKLNDLNPIFVNLITDIPTMSRLDTFVQYVRNNKLENESPIFVKQKFRKDLGTHRVYRALALTEEEFLSIKETGIDSNFLRFAGYGGQEANIAGAIQTGLLNILRDRFEFPRTKMSQDIYLSTSDYAEVAAGAVAVTIETKGKSVFIFQVDIPIADLFSIGLVPFNFPIALQQQVDKGLEALIVQPDGSFHIYNFDSTVERFAVLRIAPKNVSAIYRVKENSLPIYKSTSGKEVVPDLNQSYLVKHTTKVQ